MWDIYLTASLGTSKQVPKNIWVSGSQIQFYLFTHGFQVANNIKSPVSLSCGAYSLSKSRSTWAKVTFSVQIQSRPNNSWYPIVILSNHQENLYMKIFLFFPLIVHTSRIIILFFATCNGIYSQEMKLISLESPR